MPAQSKLKKTCRLRGLVPAENYHFLTNCFLATATDGVFDIDSRDVKTYKRTTDRRMVVQADNRLPLIVRNRRAICSYSLTQMALNRPGFCGGFNS
ncbi:hypothetical protein LFL96_36160 (plasmid) [Paraburkholderia sp. D15]|nr:hypothetical protein [Paraburkholderia sp. D15]WGS54930.1 hypothetical protein LFL96_36160 [Paraburkholderia sp. D15]